MAKLLVSPTLKFACLLYFEGLFEKISRPSCLFCCPCCGSARQHPNSQAASADSGRLQLESLLLHVTRFPLLKNFSKEGNNFLLWINLSHHLPTTFPQFFSQKVPTTASLQWQQMESETLFTILFSKLKPSKKLQACYKSSFQLAKFEFVSVGRGRKLKSCSFFGLTLVICKQK